MEDELVDIIRNVEQEKTEKGLAPVHAMFLSDIMPAVKKLVKDTLNKLVKEKKISWFRTINDDAFIIYNILLFQGPEFQCTEYNPSDKPGYCEFICFLT